MITFKPLEPSEIGIIVTFNHHQKTMKFENNQEIYKNCILQTISSFTIEKL